MADFNEPLQKRKNEDIIQTTIGDFGRWQCRVTLLMSLLKIPIAWFQLGIVFLAPPTEFWCKQPEDYKKNMSLMQWKKFIAPMTNNTKHQHIGLQSGSCFMRNIDLNPNIRHSVIPCRWGYDYNRTVVHSSIISEWNLVCGRERLVDITQISLMFGVLIGNMIFGFTGDRFGRKKTLIICIILQSFGGILSAWSPWFEGFLFFRFILAIANGGTMVLSFVMCMEVVGGDWRTIVGILYQMPFGLGNTIMAVIAYFIRDWRELQLVLSGISSLYIFYFWFIPESPRWLIATGRKEEAIEVLEKAARFNREDPSKIKPALSGYTSHAKKENPNFKALFSTKELRKRTLLLCLNWLICGTSFYAFSQYLGVVSSNIYFTVFIGGLVSLPGTIACVKIVKYCGRRKTIFSAHMWTAFCFFVILAIPKGYFPHDWPRIAFAALGIVGTSVSLPALYLFTGELFPTVLRNAGVGGSVMFSKIGSMLAPLIIALSDIYEILPLLVMGCMVVTEALLVIPLPETKDTILPETIEDVEYPYRDENKNDIMESNNVSIPLRRLDQED